MTSAQDPWAGYTPPRIDTTGPKVDQERMPLFYLTVPDEDSPAEGATREVEHTAPRRVSAPAAIRALRTIATQGPDAGAWQMIEESLEPDTLKVLETCEHVSYEQAQTMLSQLGALYYGQVKALGGK